MLKRFILIACFALTNAYAQITIYKAASIFTADTEISNANALVVKDGIILYVGNADTAVKQFPEANLSNSYDKQHIYPGFRDAHCHFLAWCKGLTEADLTGTRSEAEVLKRLQKFAKTTSRSWIIGRGWDQNDWKNKQYPGIENIDKLFPDKPVCLKRVDGHAVWINSAAVRALNLDLNKKVEGGEIVFRNGKFTGILVDNAADLVTAGIPEIPESELHSAVEKGAQICVQAGITGFDEAGLEVSDIKFLEKIQRDGFLPFRINAMLAASEKNLAWIAENGIYKNGNMRVGSVKFYLDGALGSRGALLKKDYCDRLGHKGLQLTNIQQFEQHCRYLYSQNYQVCVHAIGDSANKLALQTFKKIVDTLLDVRWRIEHAQIVDPADFRLFRQSGTIPSVQPTHATSDAPWAQSRLCNSRMAGAYQYAELLKQTGLIALGTDFPVETINPLHTFYSAVFRKDITGNVKNPFLPEGGLTREQTLLGMTIWASYAAKLDKESGSISPGKHADFVILNENLMTAPEKKVRKAKVIATFISGKQVYKM